MALVLAFVALPRRSWYRANMHADRIVQAPFRLPSPRPVATGGFIYTMVLAVPGVMDYPERGYATYTPWETLADPVWLASMVGVPVTDDDVVMHAVGLDTETIAKHRIGTILRAWWDAEQQAVLAEAVVDVQRGLDLIAQGVTGVSPAYDPAMVDEVGEYEGKRYTRRVTARRAGNNVAITTSPRGQVTRLQADSNKGGSMSFIDKLKAIHADAADPGDPMRWAFDMLMQRDADMCSAMDSMKAEFEAMKAAKSKKADEADADAEVVEEATVEEPMPDSAGDWRAVLRLAEAHNVDFKADAKLIDIQRAIASKLGHSDSANAQPAVIAAFLDGASKVATPTKHADSVGDVWDAAVKESLAAHRAKHADSNPSNDKW
jgi:hypothetical protein